MVEYRIRLHPADTRPDVLWNRISDEHAVRVGRFLAAWSLIEFKLECVIWHLIGGHPRDLRRLTARLDARPKQDSIDELIVSRPLNPEQRKAWGEARRLLKTLSGNRNWLAHGVWMPMPFGTVGVQLTAKGGLLKDKSQQPSSVALAQIKLITIDDLDGWISKASDVIRCLNALLPEMIDGAPPA